MKTPIQVLLDARQRFIDHPDWWIKNCYRHGNLTCLVGAIREESGFYGLMEINTPVGNEVVSQTISTIVEANRYCKKALYSLFKKELEPEGYNDLYAKTVNDIIKVLDKAIEGANCEEEHGNH